MKKNNLLKNNLLYQTYHVFLRFKDFIKYATSKKKEKLNIVLTFDDPPNKSSIQIPQFLSERNIYGTFFISPANTKDRHIKKIISLGHEIGGHGWSHGDEEAKKNHKESAPKCFNYLKEFYPNLSSWRFPGLRANSEAYKNVREAGFKIDSTRGSYYPVQKAQKYKGLKEYPFLRLPPKGQMDIDTGSHSQIKRFILGEVLDWKGIAVLPFHTWYEENHFEEFKDLIEELKKKEVDFKCLLDLNP